MRFDTWGWKLSQIQIKEKISEIRQFKPCRPTYMLLLSNHSNLKLDSTDLVWERLLHFFYPILNILPMLLVWFIHSICPFYLLLNWYKQIIRGCQPGFSVIQISQIWKPVRFSQRCLRNWPADFISSILNKQKFTLAYPLPKNKKNIIHERRRRKVCSMRLLHLLKSLCLKFIHGPGRFVI